MLINCVLRTLAGIANNTNHKSWRGEPRACVGSCKELPGTALGFPVNKKALENQPECFTPPMCAEAPV